MRRVHRFAMMLPGHPRAAGHSTGGTGRMSMFDNLKDQALNLAKEHKDQVENVAEQATEKIGDLIDGATGGKFADKIDAVQEKAPEQISKLLGD
jgi:4-alpha-glucanotransferase